MTVPILSLGGKGVISVSANIIPEVIHNMVMAFLNDNQKRLVDYNLDIMNFLMECL